jgi:CHAT domain-containing protein
VLTGPAATRNNFLQRAQNSSVVHLTAATADNTAFPLLSRVLLADEPGKRNSGALLGREIAATPFSRTKVVVLDETGRSNRRDTRTFSLARAFIIGGVPTVLTTLPGIDPIAARGLIAGFHREVASGAAAVDALTRIQRNALQQNGGRLGAWTALVIYGSGR